MGAAPWTEDALSGDGVAASDADVQRSALRRRPRRAEQAQYVGVAGGGSFAGDRDQIGMGSGHSAQPSQKL